MKWQGKRQLLAKWSPKMLTLQLFLIVLAAREITAEQCFSDSFGFGDGFCLSEDYNKMAVPRDENGTVFLVSFYDLVLKDVYQFNNEDDTIQLRLFG